MKGHASNSSDGPFALADGAVEADDHASLSSSASLGRGRGSGKPPPKAVRVRTAAPKLGAGKDGGEKKNKKAKIAELCEGCGKTEKDYHS